MPSTAPDGQAQHIVACIGGATAGAEVAARLAAQNVRVAVFEMNPRPFGKIEDGLPRWHVGLRQKEYAAITKKLSHPHVHFVPNTKVGRDVQLPELAREWGFSAVVLANGAWRDRPLPCPNAQQYEGAGLVYQNPFIIWFNHLEEAEYAGPQFETPDDAMVIGGGLASIDVAKVLMLESARAKLRARGINADLVEMELKGIPKTLAQHNLEWPQLGLRGCTIYYRRAVEDMPLAEIPPGADAARAKKVRAARAKLLQKAQQKYFFKLEPLCAPAELLAEGGRARGMRFRRTRVEGGRVHSTDETFERQASVIISSIGSIPEAIPGVEMKGELFAFTNWDTGRMAAYPNLFSVGNVVTGKGNIVASRKHAGEVYEAALESYLGLREDGHLAEAALAPSAAAGGESAAAATAAEVSQALACAAAPSADAAQQILARVKARQQAVGYGGSLPAWLAQVAPKRKAAEA